MRLFLIILFFCCTNSWAQQHQNLTAKRDSITNKYGYVDSTDQFVIEPRFNIAYDFISEFSAVKLDSLWGIINQKGKFIIEPQFIDQISAVYRNHFMVYGNENIIFRDLEGNIKYEYLFIPGPFKEIHEGIDTMNLSKLEDRDLIMRVFKYSDTFCHYYQKYRIYNSIAMCNEVATKLSISYVLDHPEEVKAAIEKDIAYEKAYANGDIGCCRHGAFSWK